MDQLQRRLELQKILETLLGSRNVYYQPPDSVMLKYPCIMYDLDSEQTVFADNDQYKSSKRYMITVIDRDPDSFIPGKVSKLPYSSFSRRYKADSLNHTVYNLYF